MENYVLACHIWSQLNTVHLIIDIYFSLLHFFAGWTFNILNQWINHQVVIDLMNSTYWHNIIIVYHIMTYTCTHTHACMHRAAHLNNLCCDSEIGLVSVICGNSMQTFTMPGPSSSSKVTLRVLVVAPILSRAEKSVKNSENSGHYVIFCPCPCNCTCREVKVRAKLFSSWSRDGAVTENISAVFLRCVLFFFTKSIFVLYYNLLSLA
jgi:hypothetical protein